MTATAQCPRCGEALMLVKRVGDAPMPKAAWIVAAVARATGVPLREMQSHSRYKPHVRARWAAMWQHHKDGFSTPKIGALLLRDHSTVLHGLTVVRSNDDLRTWAESLVKTVEDDAA